MVCSIYHSAPDLKDTVDGKGLRNVKSRQCIQQPLESLLSDAIAGWWCGSLVRTSVLSSGLSLITPDLWLPCDPFSGKVTAMG